MRVLLALGLAALTTATSQAQDQRRLKRSIEGSGHDFRFEIVEEREITHCSFCHSPHQPPAEEALDRSWDPRLSRFDLFILNEPADAAPQELGRRLTESSFCLSCHDGSVALNVVYERLGVHPAAFMEEGHPDNIGYDATLAERNGRLVSPASERWVDPEEDLRLFGGRMVCASCHDVHNGNPVPPDRGLFLRRRSTQETICLECHL